MSDVSAGLSLLLTTLSSVSGQAQYRPGSSSGGAAGGEKNISIEIFIFSSLPSQDQEETPEDHSEALAPLPTRISTLSMTDLVESPRVRWRRRSPGSLVMTTPSLPRFPTPPLSAMDWWREVTTLMLRLSAKCSTSVVMMATVD